LQIPVEISACTKADTSKKYKACASHHCTEQHALLSDAGASAITGIKGT